jgi:hypothetical protein
MMGDRAIYDDGWTASTRVVRLPWAGADAPISKDPRQLRF